MEEDEHENERAVQKDSEAVIPRTATHGDFDFNIYICKVWLDRIGSSPTAGI